jgi:diguanylate cyclase (GGDEF)-like protein
LGSVDIAAILSELGLFEGVSSATIATIARVSRVIRLPDGARLHRMGQAAGELYVMLSGSVVLTVGDEPSALDVARADRRGFVFGWEALVEGMPERTSNARASADSEILAVDGAIAREALKMSGEGGIRAFDRLSAASSSYLMQVSRLLAREVARRRGDESGEMGIDRARLGEIIVSFLRTFINIQPDQVDSRIVDSLKLLADFFRARAASLVSTRGAIEEEAQAGQSPGGEFARRLFGWDRVREASQPAEILPDLEQLGWARLRTGASVIATDGAGGKVLRVPAAQRGEVVGFLELAGVDDTAVADRDGARLLALVGEAFLTALVHKEVEQALRALAQFDSLTGLANRALLLDRMEGALARARRGKTSVAVLFIDLDHFKAVNDQYGHEAGDLVLKEVAVRLRESVRETDTVARLGGDEFVVLLEGLKARQDAEPTAMRFLQSMRQPILADGHAVSVSGSIGIALYPETAEDREGLIRRADAAMYDAKHHGGETFRHHRGGQAD